MPRSAKEKYVAYKQAFKIGNLVLEREDRSKIIKLLSKISKGKNVAEKLKKLTYNTQIILKTKITFNYRDQDVAERTFTLPYYAIVHKNKQAFDDLLQEAIKQELLKNVLNEEMVIKYSDGQEETHTILTYAILCKDYMMIRKVLKVSEEYGILEDILNKTVTMKDGQEITCTPFDYANIDSEIAKIFKEFITTIEHRPVPESYKDDSEKNLNATTMENKRVIEEATDNAIITESEDATAAIDNTESVLIKYEDINKTSGDLQLIFETSEKAQDALTEEEPDSPSLTELYFNSKENSADEKSSKRAIQPIVAGVVGAVLLVSCVASYLLIESSKVHVIEVIGGIIGLACIGFALYNAIKPNTKFEKVEDLEQFIAQPCLNPA